MCWCCLPFFLSLTTYLSSARASSLRYLGKGGETQAMLAQHPHWSRDTMSELLHCLTLQHSSWWLMWNEKILQPRTALLHYSSSLSEVTNISPPSPAHTVLHSCLRYLYTTILVSAFLMVQLVIFFCNVEAGMQSLQIRQVSTAVVSVNIALLYLLLRPPVTCASCKAGGDQRLQVTCWSQCTHGNNVVEQGPCTAVVSADWIYFHCVSPSPPCTIERARGC